MRRFNLRLGDRDHLPKNFHLIKCKKLSELTESPQLLIDCTKFSGC
jgi:hypothetical protein